MSDTPTERNSNSKSNLIEVQHVGVTAKLQSPLKNLFQSSTSSTETENGQVLYRSGGCGGGATTNKTKYNKFSNDTQLDTETDNSKVLYEMRAIRSRSLTKHVAKTTPSKIEFQLYNKTARRLRRTKTTQIPTKKKKSSKRKLFECEFKSPPKCNETVTEASLFQRLRHSLEHMRPPKTSARPQSKPSKLLFDCDPLTEEPPPTTTRRSSPPRDTRIGIYPFEHGCAEYLRTTDCHPQILSVVLAQRATHYATRFWAEFFGSLHIGVTFVVTFLLQSYRFVLYSVVNTLIVGFLHMTSDYLIKPILTVIFNGFLQPPLIFVFNVLTSMRDIMEPIADTLNNFMKPVATVGKSLRLVHATYNNRRTAKEV